MTTTGSKTAFLYEMVRLALQSGRYAPGERIEPAMLAKEYNTSPTPVRFALYRLVGEGLIDDRARDGLRIPIVTEVTLRELYDWMERLLIMACEIGFSSPRSGPAGISLSKRGGDVVGPTRDLFESMAAATEHLRLYYAIRQVNDILGPIRTIAQELLEGAFEEIDALNRHWQKRDVAALKIAIRTYHERRRALAPRIVELLAGRSHRIPSDWRATATSRASKTARK